MPASFQDIAADALRLPVADRRELAQRLLWSLPRPEFIQLSTHLSSLLQKDIVGLLPPELAVQVLSHLEFPAILRCSLVSRHWAKLCNEQALWSILCASHSPPLIPRQTTWPDLTLHRQLLSHPPSHPQHPSHHAHDEGGTGSDSSSSDDADPSSSSSHPLHHQAPDIIAMQGGAGGGGGIDPLAQARGVRRRVWERSSRPDGLPTHSRPPVPSAFQPSDPDKGKARDPPMLSHMPLPTQQPKVNYKHFYITHQLLSRRLRCPPPESTPILLAAATKAAHPELHPMRPRTFDAISSITAGGLPGHSETIYSLELIHRRMTIAMSTPSPDFPRLPTVRSPREVDMDLGNTPTSMTGRDWLLSGSRDKTLRLWQLDAAKPRVVKIFQGGHTGSVLSLYSTVVPHKKGGSKGQVGGEDEAGRDGRVMAVSGGSDGKICLWDVEGGDGSPEKVVDKHHDSVLCVRGDDEHVVSCSKDRTIRLFDIRTLKELLVIGGEGEEANGQHQGAVNAVALSKQYIISASGDKSVRIWSITTGRLLGTLENAHVRGIASIAFCPFPSSHPHLFPHFHLHKRKDHRLVGMITTGSSDASIKTFYLVAKVRRDSLRFFDAKQALEEIEPPMREMSFREMIEGNGDPGVFGSGEGGELLTVEKGYTCWSRCVCPTGLRRLESPRCARCLNRGHTELVRSLTHGEGVILSGSYDSSVKVWDCQSGRMLRDLSGSHVGRVFCVVGDRLRVVSSGLDCRINIWDFGEGLDTAFIEP